MKKIAFIVMVLATSACKSGTLQESDNFSGLYTLSMGAGSQLSKESALAELAKYCDTNAMPGYIERIARKLSFNAGYADHPNAGQDADIVKKVGPDGKEAWYIGQGQWYQGEGAQAMELPTNGNISALIAGYCKVAMNSFKGGSDGCAYPTAEASTGGSVSGNSARGSINSPSCLITKLNNQSIGQRAEFAFCPDALGVNFFTSSGAAGEMSAIIRSGG